MCATCHEFIKVLTFALVAWPCPGGVGGMPRRARSCPMLRRAASFVLARSSSVGGPRLPRESATLRRCSSRHAIASRASFFSRYLLDASLHFSFFSSEAISNLKMNRDTVILQTKKGYINTVTKHKPHKPL